MVRGYPKALSRRTDPRTSKAAAESFDGKDLETLSGQVLAAIAERGRMGATAEEVSDIIRRSKQTVTPRIRPLAREFKIINTGGTRANRSGRQAIIWRWLPPDQREEFKAAAERAEPRHMTVGKLRRALARLPQDAKVQVVVADLVFPRLHKVMDVVAVKRGDRYAKDEGLGPANGEGPYELLALDEEEVILEADEVGEWEDGDV